MRRSRVQLLPPAPYKQALRQHPASGRRRLATRLATRSHIASAPPPLPAYPEFAAAVQSAKALADIIKAAHSLSNYNELVTAVAEVNMKLMAASAVALESQEKQATMAARIAELEREIGELRKAQQQADRYGLHQFEVGTLAYKLKESDADGAPMHYLCAKCFDAGKHTKLQPSGERRLYCPECKVFLRIKPEPPLKRRGQIGSPWS